ncbi:uncharacterized protein LOC108111346 [Drosophila eugracilis]|uniref:uncharacterized protein LOC108111346 n=1 Tax=Drosophila eugracilis TaxID=29029 RepID=UPI001BD9D444|nr:uncharacterized protein LOC108111346 [Drosophila eugracilis]
MERKPNYKLCERDLDISSDLEFVDSLLKDLRLEAEPQARGVILDLAYTLARDKLLEAQRFAILANRTNVSVEDLEMANMERTEELRRRPCQQPLKSRVPCQTTLPMPSGNRGLLLPTWRQCQLGTMAELKSKGSEPTQPNPRVGLPLNPVATAVPGTNILSVNSTSFLGPSIPNRIANPRPMGSLTPGTANGRSVMMSVPGLAGNSSAGPPGCIPPAQKKPRA